MDKLSCGTCKHVDYLESELSDARFEHACCKRWADDARKQRNVAMQAGREMLEVLTVKAAGGVYSPDSATVQRWRDACTPNMDVYIREHINPRPDREEVGT